MPTLIELQRQQAPTKSQSTPHSGEELVADRRAGLRPSQVVDRKLAAHRLTNFSRTATTGFPRPR